MQLDPARCPQCSPHEGNLTATPGVLQGAPRLSAMLRRLNKTTNAQGMNLPGWGLHPLKGRELKDHFSVWVNGNWRMTFTFDGTDAVLVDYQDYH